MHANINYMKVSISSLVFLALLAASPAETEPKSTSITGGTISINLDDENDKYAYSETQEFIAVRRKLEDKKKSICSSALLNPSLAKFSELLIPELMDYRTSKESCLILGRLHISEELKNSLLSSPTTPELVRARLGDSDAEDAIINNFENASDSELIKKCMELFYVESKKCMETFAKALESDVVVTYGSDSAESRASILIMTYYRVYDRRKENFARLLENSVSRKGDFLKPKHQAYLRELEVYFSQALGRDISIKAPFMRLGAFSMKHVTPHVPKNE